MTSCCSSVPIVRIIFPPQFEPYQPYLSLPYIKGVLNCYNIESECIDANVDFYWWLYENKNYLRDKNCARKKYLHSNITRAIQTVRAIPQDLLEYRWAMNLLDEYLKYTSPPDTEISLSYFRTGNNYSSLDLREFIQSNNNIFREYFDYTEKKILGDVGTKYYMFSIAVIDQLIASLTIAEEIKKRRSNVVILAGGPLISRLYRCLTNIGWLHNIFDQFIPGEASEVLPAVLGVSQQNGNHISPDFIDFDLGRYFCSKHVLPYIVAYGCKWARCAFCSHHLSYVGYKESKIDDVVDDIAFLSDKYNTKHFTFSDEYLSSEQLSKLADLLQDKGLNVKWSTFARAEPAFADEDFMGKLYNVGCRMLMFGFESASQEVLNRMRKGTMVSHYRPILEACKSANIVTRIDFMIGFPGEKHEDVKETFSFIKENRDFLDTPFSSFALAIFELRDGIPMMSDLDYYGVHSLGSLRGDLDEQFRFDDTKGLSWEEKKKWRSEIIRFAKNDMDFELVTPRNKTHQLVLKDLFDLGYFSLPVTKIDDKTIRHLWAQWASGVEYDNIKPVVRMQNYATGGVIEVSNKFYNTVDILKHGTVLDSALSLYPTSEFSSLLKVIDFLYRNDYLYLKKIVGIEDKVND
jgi:pyruvate-formate lyase-activating enzyme